MKFFDQPFPLEITAQIFSYLPPKELMQNRYLSKRIQTAVEKHDARLFYKTLKTLDK